ncbi:MULTISPECIES: bifunctional adenosylcobinamide kinase/adenosylcobinamide-phosphate guanylyltransferase [Halanaerobium]|jgi:adenosylcobinamide kinase/adenosylcobinamide-phosphate guanylyltransferase|uniref:Adenosylcobinamide kinase n=1 Tax=Halanaerobium congolense TaxID=54121 RepID=A0A1G6L2A6_9FIRM|nr:MULTISPECIES: bifunctional adenosylcobinamide kinase/adenosylcobinamide-phosphate guanylyltransferase [Halanaerobium]PUU90407.1 MAG: adenosylcobinamide kinase / adenosylcobinamide-phosphate guanylyltransferase [Halanaerobium sp.]PUU91901.1 MAG: adenosylcobinamide kinase / adenosylcobinamide-phosphate guanylyltransferase [Halanaerobium sp.]PXV64805.1 adenosylcobinamide kinase /adenosylcobinamide-phosphate guanylyltransferase [Halanaerobium congolense]TDP14356.1 adenosylcobinamide kinase /aden
MGVILIQGGARSGKSSFAELIAKKIAGLDVIYLASGVVTDSEMELRIEKHQKQRPSEWQTVEEAYSISSYLKNIEKNKTILFDCLTTYLGNLIFKKQNKDFEKMEAEILDEVEIILKIARKKELNLIIVQNETGKGVVPASKMGRDFRDISGRAARMAAKYADKVYLVQAGLPLEIKEKGLKNIKKFTLDDEEVRVL